MSCNDKIYKTSSPLDLTEKPNDSNFIDGVINEAINIGGAKVNVYKLLGLKERGSLTDSTGHGVVISGGDGALNFSATEAFSTSCSEWRSAQRGQSVLKTTYIGYDFGEIKLDNGRARYGIDAHLRLDIATIKLKQGGNSKNRATKIRVERSENGDRWYGAAIVTVPDNDALNTLYFKRTVPSRYWRIRPVEFNGGESDWWSVKAMQMMEFEKTQIGSIEDRIFLENRNREYAENAVKLKGAYDLLDTQTELSRFGIELPSQQFYLTMHFNTTVAALGRPFVIGDILELPSETQYAPDMTPIKKYIEVTDVGWSTEGYTPGWQPTLQRLVAQPVFASQETQDVTGDLGSIFDDIGTDSTNDGMNPIYQDISNIDQTIHANSKTEVPQKGEDTADLGTIGKDILANHPDAGRLDMVGDGKRLYIQDAMPPNGELYSESAVLPEVSKAKDGDYHRVTYEHIDTNIPTRLYKYSGSKMRWVYMETDKREFYDNNKGTLDEFISSPTAVSMKDVGK